MNALRKALLENEEWLMERVRDYTQERGYTRYTSTLISAWKLSIAGLTESLLLTLDNPPEALDFGPDDTFCSDPAACFASGRRNAFGDKASPCPCSWGCSNTAGRPARTSLAKRSTAPIGKGPGTRAPIPRPGGDGRRPGVGTSCDPVLADCFLDIRDEFRRIAQEYGEFDDKRRELANPAWEPS